MISIKVRQELSRYRQSSIAMALEIALAAAAAIGLYFGSDWALTQIEYRVGRRLEHRSLIFFAILLVSALTVVQAVAWFSRQN